MTERDLDTVGYWTEIKLRILRDYANAYAQVLSKQPMIRHFAYIDGFAGAGTHISKSTGQEIEGSPAIALAVKPPFSHYHFIDLDGKRAARLRELAGGRRDVTVYEHDCNKVLLEEVFPSCRFEDYRRALCLLGPYGLNPDWKVIEAAGRMKSIEIFLNFLIMDANMNVLWRRPDDVPEAQARRMNAFWGDDSWRRVAYSRELGLFGEMEEKRPNYSRGFRVALHEQALDLPLRWKKPQMVFVNSMSDLFHEDVPLEFIRRVFAVMEEAYWHRFQVLTKRSARLAELAPLLSWPDNVWMGVTVESADLSFRIDDLRDVPATVRFLSLEPLLGPVLGLDLNGIDWVIAGGESGPGARPMSSVWVRGVLQQCRRSRVFFFFKQWGGTNKKKAGRMLDGVQYNEMPSAGTTRR